MADPSFNILALLQAAQQAQGGARTPGMGMGTGPIPAQNPTPGFRPIGLPNVQPPQMQQQQNPMAGASGLQQALAGIHPNPGASPTSGGATPGVPAGPGSADPTGGSGPAFLGGATPLGSPTQQPGLLDFLTGKWRSLFGSTPTTPTS